VAVESASNSKGNAMTEYQNIAAGLLGLTHPEIYWSLRKQADKAAQPATSLEPASMNARQPNSDGKHAGAAVRAIKFAFAALVAGSRTVPLGDNGQITKELGAYGEHLSR
jgi:hypothetical protein